MGPTNQAIDWILTTNGNASASAAAGGNAFNFAVPAYSAEVVKWQSIDAALVGVAASVLLYAAIVVLCVAFDWIRGLSPAGPARKAPSGARLAAPAVTGGDAAFGPPPSSFARLARTGISMLLL